MNTIEKLLAELRAAEALHREFGLAEIAKTYGEGFARVLRERLEAMAKR